MYLLWHLIYWCVVRKTCLKLFVEGVLIRFSDIFVDVNDSLCIFLMRSKRCYFNVYKEKERNQKETLQKEPTCLLLQPISWFYHSSESSSYYVVIGNRISFVSLWRRNINISRLSNQKRRMKTSHQYQIIRSALSQNI